MSRLALKVLARGQTAVGFEAGWLHMRLSCLACREVLSQTLSVETAQLEASHSRLDEVYIAHVDQANRIAAAVRDVDLAQLQSENALTERV